jgi:hypothetical protein
MAADGASHATKSPADATCGSASARRTPADKKLYRVDFTLSSNDVGKPPTTSAYTINLEDETTGEIRMGSNIALSSNARQDVGLMIRTSYVPVDDNILLEATFELSGAEDGGSIRKIMLRGSALLASGKETLLASVEDPISHKKFQLSATAQKIR